METTVNSGQVFPVIKQEPKSPTEAVPQMEQEPKTFTDAFPKVKKEPNTLTEAGFQKMVGICQNHLQEQTKSVQDIVNVCSQISGYEVYCHQIMKFCNQIISEALDNGQAIIQLCKSFADLDFFSNSNLEANLELTPLSFSFVDPIVKSLRPTQSVNSVSDDDSNSDVDIMTTDEPVGQDGLPTNVESNLPPGTLVGAGHVAGQNGQWRTGGLPTNVESNQCLINLNDPITDTQIETCVNTSLHNFRSDPGFGKKNICGRFPVKLGRPRKSPILASNPFPKDNPISVVKHHSVPVSVVDLDGAITDTQIQACVKTSTHNFRSEPGFGKKNIRGFPAKLGRPRKSSKLASNPIPTVNRISVVKQDSVDSDINLDGAMMNTQIHKCVNTSCHNFRSDQHSVDSDINLDGAMMNTQIHKCVNTSCRNFRSERMLNIRGFPAKLGRPRKSPSKLPSNPCTIPVLNPIIAAVTKPSVLESNPLPIDNPVSVVEQHSVPISIVDQTCIDSEISLQQGQTFNQVTQSKPSDQQSLKTKQNCAKSIRYNVVCNSNGQTNDQSKQLTGGEQTADNNPTRVKIAFSNGRDLIVDIRNKGDEQPPKNDRLNDKSKQLNVDQLDDLNVDQSDNLNVDQSDDLDVDQSDDLNVDQSDDLNVDQSDDLNINQSDILDVNQSDDLNLDQSDNLNIDQSDDSSDYESVAHEDEPDPEDPEWSTIGPNKVYKCSVCSKTFISEFIFEKHRRSHKSYECPFCGRKFAKKSILKEHKTKQHKDELDDWDPDNCSDSDEVEGKRNKAKTTTLADLTCNICEKHLSNIHNLRTHKLIVHSKSYKCPFCGRKFAKKSILMEHKTKQHKDELDDWDPNNCSDYDEVEGKRKRAKSPTLEDVTCDICGKIYPGIHGLKAHRKTHSNKRSFICDHCGKGFNAKRDLTSHLETHMTTQSYPCDLCEYATVSRSRLAQHMTVHSNEKRFQCEECGERFARKGSLVKHGAVHFTSKPFSCDLCEKKFSCKNRLRLHKIIHTDEMKYACDICGKRSHQQHNIVVHMRTHTGHKPFSCNICGKKFAHNVSLRHHKNSCRPGIVQ